MVSNAVGRLYLFNAIIVASLLVAFQLALTPELPSFALISAVSGAFLGVLYTLTLQERANHFGAFLGGVSTLFVQLEPRYYGPLAGDQSGIVLLAIWGLLFMLIVVAMRRWG